jgi:hypothetical protein
MVRAEQPVAIKVRVLIQSAQKQTRLQIVTKRLLLSLAPGYLANKQVFLQFSAGPIIVPLRSVAVLGTVARWFERYKGDYGAKGELRDSRINWSVERFRARLQKRAVAC